MLHKKEGFPKEGDILLCTVKKILPNSIFVNLDEYKYKEGLIHISEISPGRIRNLRDFVKENKKIVCKVIKINQQKNHIDLSLRRVSLAQRKNKLTEIKQEEKAIKILELVAKDLKINPEKLHEKIGKIIIEQYGSLNACFQSIVLENNDIKELKLPEEYTKVIIKIVKEKIKSPEVKIKSNIILNSEAPNGIEIIKDTIKKTLELSKTKKYNLEVGYLSAPKYSFSISSSNYKKAEKELQELSDYIIKEISQKGGKGELLRK